MASDVTDTRFLHQILASRRGAVARGEAHYSHPSLQGLSPSQQLIVERIWAADQGASKLASSIDLFESTVATLLLESNRTTAQAEALETLQVALQEVRVEAAVQQKAKRGEMTSVQDLRKRLHLSRGRAKESPVVEKWRKELENQKSELELERRALEEERSRCVAVPSSVPADTHREGALVQKYLDALQRNPFSASAWLGLGMQLDVSDVVLVFDEPYSQRDCFVEALVCDPEESRAWHHLGVALACQHETAEVAGQVYGPRACYVEALHLNPRECRSWYNLALTLAPDESCTVDGEVYSKQRCYVRAIECSPTHRDAWYNLGVTMGTTTQRVTINGRVVSERDCYIEALRCDPECSNAWHNLGYLLSKGESVKVGEAMESKESCYVHALECASKEDGGADTWRNLAVSLKPAEESAVVVQGRRYNKRDCFAEMASLSPLPSSRRASDGTA